jgi:hypothetical protein
MKGSSTRNIKFDRNKQKIVKCEVCNKEIVVGKFAKRGQLCAECRNIPKGKDSLNKHIDTRESFGQKFIVMMNKLGFTVTDKRLWKKKYAVDGGSVVTIYPMIEQGVAGEGPRLEYISMTVQRAIGLDEDFRKFLPADPATDCELLATEFGTERKQIQIGQEKCDICGAITDQFGVDTKRGKVLCIRPNNCWRKHFNNSGAEAEV